MVRGIRDVLDRHRMDFEISEIAPAFAQIIWIRKFRIVKDNFCILSCNAMKARRSATFNGDRASAAIEEPGSIRREKDRRVGHRTARYEDVHVGDGRTA